ncbi:hypothetical protein [Cylindrospermopsis raciborskii]|uniref:hypothetical protein n=1 Tax=Cylindrospermopsis raciborskii TaxID=77022 RepID=UPI001BA982E8|nr:hypothetical protein [Cylindrospermopsis raciborskii]
MEKNNLIHIEQAVRRTIETFPFQSYMAEGKGAYYNIARTVQRYLEPGSAILDFGSGPADKTAVLQYLGFNCSAYDDLQDDWHKLPENRQKILSFAEKCGINFCLAGQGMLPFSKNTFEKKQDWSVKKTLSQSELAAILGKSTSYDYTQ